MSVRSIKSQTDQSCGVSRRHKISLAKLGLINDATLPTLALAAGACQSPLLLSIQISAFTIPLRFVRFPSAFGPSLPHAGLVEKVNLLQQTPELAIHARHTTVGGTPASSHSREIEASKEHEESQIVDQ